MKCHRTTRTLWSHIVLRWPRTLFLLAATLLYTPVLFAQTRNGVILLKNDGVLSGKIERRGEFYVVSIADDSRVSVHSDKVQFVGQDVQAIYQFRLDSIANWSVGDHFKLTRWCMTNGMLDQATHHYLKVSKQASGHPRVQQLAVELQEKLLDQPEFRVFLGLPPLGDRTERQLNAVVSDHSGSSDVLLASASLAETAMHPEIASRYSQRIQPILMNRCSQAACHGAQGKNTLRLIAPYTRANARISSQNLASVLAQVSRNSGELSKLLKYATTAHGIQRQPAISATETQLLSELRNWVQFVQNPVVNAVSHVDVGAQQQSVIRRAQSHQFVPYSAGVSLTPVQPGNSGLRQVPGAGNRNATDPTGFPGGQEPTLGEIDALDQQLRQMLGEENASGAGYKNSGDPFDPEEFNRQTRRGQ